MLYIRNGEQRNNAKKATSMLLSFIKIGQEEMDTKFKELEKENGNCFYLYF